MSAFALEHEESAAAAVTALETVKSRLAAALLQAGTSSPSYDPWLNASAFFSGTAGNNTVKYTAVVADVNGRLNLNTATEEELTRFFLALGAQPGQALAVAAGILDWRDPDSVKRPNGAEEQDYLLTNAGILPHNDVLSDVAELLYVASMTPELYQRALPHVTVLGDSRINIHSAGRPVLLALRGMSDEASTVLAARRSTGRLFVSLLDLWNSLSPVGRATLGPEMPALSARTILGVREVEIRAEGWLEGSPVRARVLALVGHSAGQLYTSFRKWY
jgi:type II secretory pathway component PulK